MRSGRRNKIIPFLTHPAFLAVPVYFLILFLGNIRVDEFRFRISDFLKEDYTLEKNSFSDIDRDGFREQVRAYNLATNATITATGASRTFIEAWNLPGFWYEHPEFILEDYDGDGTDEMYALTLNKGDSVLVHQLVLKQDHRALRSRYVCTIGEFNGQHDQVMNLLGFCELTGDHQKDLVFHINGGFTLQPRAIYAWDLTGDSIFRSPFHGINSKRTEQFICCSDSIGQQSLHFIRSTATDNYKEPVPYPDTASYAVVLTHKLNYLFDPIPVGGAQSNTTTYPFSLNGRNQILAVTVNPRKTTDKLEIYLMDKDGSILKHRRSRYFDQCDYRYTPWVNGRVLLIRSDNTRNTTQFSSINENLELQPEAEFSGSFNIIYPVNLDNDPELELVLGNWTSRKLLILQEDLHLQAEAELPFSDFTKFSLELKSQNKLGFTIYVQSMEHSCDIQLSKNKLFPFRWLIYLFYYVLIALTFYLLKLVLSYTGRQRAEREKALISYQMQTVLNQLNPHFTFNAINSIGDAVLEGRKDEAYEYFTKLSNLIRKSMTHAMEPYKSLGEEIEFVRDYLEIEKYRFGERFEWDLEVEPEVDVNMPVPKMLIQIFVENALKHGIFHLEKSGTLKISIQKEKSHSVIHIVDNGIGMARAYEIEGRKGQGIHILDQYLKIYNSSFPHSISYKTISNSANASHGTTVIIRIRD